MKEDTENTKWKSNSRIGINVSITCIETLFLAEYCAFGWVVGTFFWVFWFCFAIAWKFAGESDNVSIHVIETFMPILNFDFLIGYWVTKSFRNLFFFSQIYRIRQATFLLFSSKWPKKSLSTIVILNPFYFFSLQKAPLLG